MANQVAESPAAAESLAKNLWYAPNRRIQSKAAAVEAKTIEAWIRGDRQQDEPDEHALFAALHTCAYRARRQSGEKPVSERERMRWIRRWQHIRAYLVERNQGLVYSLINKFRASSTDEDDLLSDAMFGLTRAVDRFNPWKGYRFSTYACNVIVRALSRRGKRESRYRQLFPVQYDVSFERAEPASDFATDLRVERLTRVLNNNLGDLTDLESAVVTQRFLGENALRPTLREIAETVGLSKERVRQIQNIALRKLRDVLNADPILK